MRIRSVLSMAEADARFSKIYKAGTNYTSPAPKFTFGVAAFATAVPFGFLPGTDAHARDGEVDLLQKGQHAAGQREHRGNEQQRHDLRYTQREKSLHE